MSEERIIVLPKSRLPAIGFFVGVALIVAIGLVGYAAYKKLMEENIRLRNEVTDFKKLTETLARSSNQWTTKDDLRREMTKLLTPEDLEELKKDIKAQGARLSAVGRTVAKLNRRIVELEKSDREGPENTDLEKCDDGRLVDVHGYTKNPQIKRVKDANDASVADVTFNAAKSKPWSYETFPRKYDLTTIVSQKESGQYVFHHDLKYQTGADGEKKFPVDIVQSNFKQAQLGSKFYWLNPRMDINLFAGGQVWGFSLSSNPPSPLSLGADLGISLSSYGETKVDSWWRLFRFGIGYEANRRAAHLSFAPALFNLGKVLPLLSNLYVGPQVGVDTAGGLKLGIGIGPQL